MSSKVLYNTDILDITFYNPFTIHNPFTNCKWVLDNETQNTSIAQDLHNSFGFPAC